MYGRGVSVATLNTNALWCWLAMLHAYSTHIWYHVEPHEYTCHDVQDYIRGKAAKYALSYNFYHQLCPWFDWCRHVHLQPDLLLPAGPVRP